MYLRKEGGNNRPEALVKAIDPAEPYDASHLTMVLLPIRFYTLEQLRKTQQKAGPDSSRRVGFTRQNIRWPLHKPGKGTVVKGERKALVTTAVQ
ncbi:hypothetical protein MTO96_043017 [Rhipicephalus appendiculatus]